MNAPHPPDEARRLGTLRSYGILDTVPEEAYDDLALLASHICQTPLAQISLVDEHRQWFKARVGLTATETPRDIAFCSHTILHADQVMEIRDAQADPRFAQSPLVTGDPHVRFYAGAPLVAPNGQALGALCVMDRNPRALTPEQLTALRALSRRVVAQLELRRQARELARQGEIAEKSRRALLSVLEDEKRSGQGLRESEERFRQVVENITEVFWMTDTAKNQMLYISPAYEKIWGRTCKSLYESPRNWMEAIYPEDRAAVIEAMLTKQMRGGYDETYRIMRPDGSLRWIHDRAYPIQDHLGRVHRVVGTAEDITEHRQLETQFRQAQKMEAIGTLAGGIAHDFNNILGAIIGYAELTKMKLKDNPVAHNHLGALLQGAHRAAALVKQILAFSRQQEQEKGLIQLRHVVAEPLTLLRATIPATITIDAHLASNLPAVLADATQVHQVVMNLCTNAWHAMKDRPGRLEVRLDRVDVDASLAQTNPNLMVGPYVRLAVSDTGHGMDRATMERIFEPFFTTKPVGEGTGLGLAAVHGIMKSHEGAVTVDSQPGKGTTFQLYFPAQEAEADKVAEQATEVPRGRGEQILFVDDEKPLALLGRAMLEELGYVVTISNSSTEALHAFRAEPAKFALVITDLTMPVMTGTDLAVQLLQFRPNLPIILTTGYTASLTVEKIRALRISELLLKPHTLRSLGTAVHRVLANAKLQ